MKRAICLLTVILLIFVFSFSTFAGEEIGQINLKKAMELALDNNVELKQARKNLQLIEKDIDLYRDFYKKNYNLSVSSDYKIIDKESFYPPNTNSSLISLTRVISPKSQLTLQQNVLLMNENDELNLLGSGSLTYTYDLLENFDLKSNYDYELEMKKLAVLEAQKNVFLKEQEIKYQVIKQYTGILKLQEQLSLKKEQLKQSFETKKVVDARVQAGESIQLDLQEAELEVERNFLEVEKAKTDINFALISMEDVLGTKLSEQVVLQPINEPSDYSLDISECQAIALDKNPDLEYLQKQLQLEKWLLEKMKKKDYPEVQLFASFQWMEEFENTDFEVGFNLNYNFGTYQEQQKKLALENQLLKIERIKSQMSEFKDALKLQIESNIESLREYKRQIEFSEKAIEAARKAEEIALIKYEAGLVTVSEVFTRQLYLAQKKLEHLNMQLDYYLRIFEIKKLMGLL